MIIHHNHTDTNFKKLSDVFSNYVFLGKFDPKCPKCKTEELKVRIKYAEVRCDKCNLHASESNI